MEAVKPWVQVFTFDLCHPPKHPHRPGSPLHGNGATLQTLFRSGWNEEPDDEFEAPESPRSQAKTGTKSPNCGGSTSTTGNLQRSFRAQDPVDQRTNSVRGGNFQSAFAHGYVAFLVITCSDLQIHRFK